MVSRPALLAAAASTAIVIALPFAVAALADGEGEGWYGINLDVPVEKVPGALVENGRADPPFARIDHPSPPWSEALLNVDAASRKVTGMRFVDNGVPPYDCPATPCPTLPRIKTVAALRAEGEGVKSDLVRRIGVPTERSADRFETRLVWDFDDPGLECADGRLRTRVLGGDERRRLRRIELRLSDARVYLEIMGREAYAATPGVPVPPAPPAPPPPPAPACP